VRLRLTLDRLTVFDVTLLEPDETGDPEPAEPDAVHDLTAADLSIGFTPAEDTDATR
jgi:hypothetical protein